MKRAVIAVFTGAALVMTGCSGESEGTAISDLGQEGESQAAPSSEPSDDSPDLPHSGAPDVSNPLPKSVLSGDPCRILDEKQVQEALGEDATQGRRADENSLGPACEWENASTLGSFMVNYYTEGGEGLSASYANSKPQVEVFNETGPIEGYPAVSFKEKSSDPMCAVVVGIANEYAVGAVVTLSTDKAGQGADPCEPAEWVSEQVVRNLKAEA
ncbi:DUF3558 domain-containing protein [Prauserella rugosa]|uniref:Uncharacterized protein DUF3558 n=1 Tax=Prauserella rugosa TaxID=43354 RepID=A0A660CDB9_9PSEU|nr:hypothetical protein ACZ91_49760 [Streptomyces regensis]TWH21326.1 uncharacterized protein DUF3558 [Prauserella rugosa]